MLCSGSSARSTKTNVQRDARGGDMGVHPVKHHVVVFILVEAKVEERAHGSAGLRHAVHDSFLNAPGERVSSTRVIAQKRGEITYRREAETENRWVLCGVDQLIDVVRVEPAIETNLRRARGARKRHGRAVGKRPLIVGDQLAWVILVHALGQNTARVVEGDRLVTRCCGAGIRAAAEVL